MQTLSAFILVPLPSQPGHVPPRSYSFTNFFFLYFFCLRKMGASNTKAKGTQRVVNAPPVKIEPDGTRIVLLGLPGAGKTTFFRQIQINFDELHWKSSMGRQLIVESIPPSLATVDSDILAFYSPTRGSHHSHEAHVTIEDHIYIFDDIGGEEEQQALWPSWIEIADLILFFVDVAPTIEVTVCLPFVY